MHKDFVNIAKSIKNECLLKTESLFVGNRQSWFADFADHFETLCKTIQEKQEKLELSLISYLEYTMLYTNFVNRQYIAEVLAYGDEHYSDLAQSVIGVYDISFLFVYFDELWDKLLLVRKSFPGQITAQEITSFMLESVSEFYSYLTNIVRFTIANFGEMELFKNIKKGESLMICVGEYMSKTEPVYIEKKDKDSKEIIDWFLEELDEVYMCGDYSNLDFSGYSFEYNNYCYSNFRGSFLNNTSLKGALLMGTCFRNAHMEECRLDNAIINEADFSNAILRNASFVGVCGKVGLPDDKEWRHAGFLPISFRNADLTGADFTSADLTGADFSNAILEGANFTNAITVNAIFVSVNDSNTLINAVLE